MLRRLPIGLAQVKAGNTSENYFIKSDKPYILFFVSSKKNH